MTTRLDVKQGDRSRLAADLVYPVGSDFTGATGRFLMRAVGATVNTVTAVATVGTVTTDAAGLVHVPVYYDPTATDFGTPGAYYAEWELTVNSKKFTSPAKGYLLIIVHPDLG